MKQILYFATISLLLSACGTEKELVSETKEVVTNTTVMPPQDVSVENSDLIWLNIESATKRAKKDGKMIFVDVYTDWCGWCKKMDASTFKDPEVMEYMNKHFYVVKFNAEQKEEIVFRGETYKFIPTERRGYHQLAAVLLDNSLGYPSFAILDSNGKRIKKLVGYQTKEQLLAQLKALN